LQPNFLSAYTTFFLSFPTHQPDILPDLLATQLPQCLYFSLATFIKFTVDSPPSPILQVCLPRDDVVAWLGPVRRYGSSFDRSSIERGKLSGVLDWKENKICNKH
jgi:hypothetical protein